MIENMNDKSEIIKSLEIAGSIHKKVRTDVKKIIKPGIKLLEIAEFIEKKTIEYSDPKHSINKGIGFPVGLSINECAAHYHPPPNDNTILKKDDIIKVDFGIEVNEWIIDSAFTLYFNDKHDILNKAVKEATYTGIKNAGIDVDIMEWSNSIKEVMEAYDIHPIRNLGGHNIQKGIIHGGYFLPSYPDPNITHKRFSEGVYAIETFGSTNMDIADETGISNIFRINPNMTPTFKLESSKKFYNKIKHDFKTLPFSSRFLNDLPNMNTHLNILVKNENIFEYPPLCVSNGYTAQYEHTIFLDETKKIIFSQDEDY